MESDYKYFIYCRKSSEDANRQIASIGDQINALEQISLREKLNIVKPPFIEEKSAKNPGRIIFNEMLKRIEKGEANALFCWDIDRLSRNPLDNGQLQWMLQRGVIKVIKTPGRSFFPEDAGLLMSIEGGRATDFIIRLSKNVKRGLYSKALRGWRPSGGTIGYINTGAVKGEKTISKDPERFEIVRRIFDYFLTGGYSVSKILEIATLEWGLRTPKHRKIGGKPLSLSHLYNVLNDSFYYGYFEWKEPETGIKRLIKGNHEPMITEEEFQRIQTLLGKKGKPQPKTHEFAFTGLMKCGECGSAITAEEKNQVICTICKYKFSSLNRTACPTCHTDISEMKNPTILNYTYYHCTKRVNKNCSQKSIKIEDLETEVVKLLEPITLDNDLREIVFECLKIKDDDNSQSTKLVHLSLQSVINNCLKRLENLKREFVSEKNTDYKIFTDEEYIEQKEAILAEKQAAEKNLALLNGNGQVIQNKLINLYNFCSTALQLFKSKQIQIQRMILAALGSNLRIYDKKLLLDKHFPFIQVEKIVEADRQYFEAFEPEKKLEIYEPNAIYLSRIPLMLPQVEAIRNWFYDNPDFYIPDKNILENLNPH